MKAVVLKILILGGTHFLGIHLTEECQKQGHEVTLFNRGSQNPDLFPDVTKLQGNRDGNLQALLGHRWDAVIDTSGHLPRIVEQSAKILSNAANHYTFISTIGVYENFHTPNIDEGYPIAKLEDLQNEVITDTTYGALKGLCETIIQRYFPKRALIIRPGLIVGPHDPTDRFTYWVKRVAEQEEVLAPAHQLVQLIDVRDLSKWIVQMVEKQTTGVYNATGATVSLEDLLQECKQASHHETHVTWVSEDFLLRKGVRDWVELPLWLSSKRQMPGFFSINSQKAIEEGLMLRPLTETISSILRWDATRSISKLQAGLDYSKEKELLLDWKREGYPD